MHWGHFGAENAIGGGKNRPKNRPQSFELPDPDETVLDVYGGSGKKGEKYLEYNHTNIHILDI